MNRELVAAGILSPRGVGERFKFWEEGGNVVFPKVNCSGDHYVGVLQVQGYSVIEPPAGTSDNAGYQRVGARHGGESVTVDGVSK